ncbi:hypothetical protein [Colwellia sp. E2M01]|uniref:hypothetical protein n=1 Tax=Colwellia sp. E2M01 TaxID=2841561 RepID=UPI001C09CB33|nr:hypothetical protein [Colwellia sp. E2M01]MBU2869974.1 hypothetical protein [Colwellia sp. E2M01]
MFNQLAENIKALTLQANRFVDDHNIEQCLTTLKDRQHLLEQYKIQLLTNKPTPECSQAFTSLLLWVQQEDAISSAKVVRYKEQSKQASVNQVKIKKALNHYKNNS